MTRRYDIDALRVFAFSLLILYHVGMFYVADWDWHIKSRYQMEWLQLPMLFLNQWRMPLLFLISGLAINFIWGRDSVGIFARRRCLRLGLPLLFGMAFVIPPQPYFEALSKGMIDAGFAAFLADYLTWQRFPDGAWADTTVATWTWNHLWYLPYVLAYTLLLVPIASVLDGAAKPFREAFAKLRGPWLIVVPLVPMMLAGWYVYPHFPYYSRALVGDWYAHSQYFTFFLLGYLIGKRTELWSAIAKIRLMSLTLAMVMFILFLNRENYNETAELLVTYLNRWTWILAVLGYGHQYLDRPMPWLPYATSAVFAWYILHQTFIIVTGAKLTPLALGPVVEPLLVLTITVAGCAASYHYLIRPVRWLRPLFGAAIDQQHPQQKSGDS